MSFIVLQTLILKTIKKNCSFFSRYNVNHMYIYRENALMNSKNNISKCSFVDFEIQYDYYDKIDSFYIISLDSINLIYSL